MPRTIYITTELPYFPGQPCVMALHMRHLSREGELGIVGPRYPHNPQESVAPLKAISHSYWWPDFARPGPLPTYAKSHRRAFWLKYIPTPIKRTLLHRMTGLYRYSDDAVAWRLVLVNLAPKILEALEERPWNSLLLSQSTSSVWLKFLPASLARTIYFHDIRSDYLEHAPAGFARQDLKRILYEEQFASKHCEGSAYVSDLDRQRAALILRPVGDTTVAPLCLDLDYFTFSPPAEDTTPVVLFTGNLSHPPNIDSVLYFLAEIWPHIKREVASARCLIVGARPGPSLVEAAQMAEVELHADVPDIRPYFRQARAYIVPMRFGGGVRNKILEAWAWGVPVVSTTLGAEGIDAEDGRNCWLRDNPREFAQQVIALISCPIPNKVLQAARQKIELLHTSAQSSPRLSNLIKATISRKRNQYPKVLFDLRWLQPGKVGGVEQMTRELVDELARIDHRFDYRFYGARSVLQKWNFTKHFRHKKILTDGWMMKYDSWRNACIDHITADLHCPPLTSNELEALEIYANLDFTVVHGIPCYVHPDLRRFPSVVTMHDLQHLHFPEFFSPEDIATREREYRESCQHATQVICVSEFTRQDVHRRYKVPLEKLTTIWNLPPRPQQSGRLRTNDQKLLARMGVRQPFLFYPAQPWLHKNHKILLQAFAAALPSLPAGCQLIMSGQPLPADHPAFPLLHDTKLCKRVLHVGYRNPAEISALYRAAEALVFPSLFEGFGMPIVEAMQCGCLIVCGTHTSLPEIAGSAAHYVDVMSIEQLAASMVKITRDLQLRARLKAAANENLRRFDRRELAEKHREIYAKVHAAHFS